jgi:putative addiction module component (TIGR02574 family)
MTREMVLRAAKSLPSDEQAQLVREIWDSLAESGEPVRLSEAQERELERCYQAHLADPKEGKDWDEVRAEIEGVAHGAESRSRR